MEVILIKQSINVGILGSKTYPPKIGGIETHIYYLTNELEKRDLKFFIFVGGKEKQKLYERAKKNINIIRVYQSKNRYLLKISMVFPIFLKLQKFRNKINVYHAHDSVFGFFLSMLGYHPLIYTAHGCAFLRSDWPLPVKLILKFMERITFKKADAIICVDFKTKQVVERYRKEGVFVIPNGVDPKKFENLERPTEYDPSKIIIFSAGRLIPSKGFQDLIDAYLMLDENVKNKAELFIAGAGPYLNFLKEKASVDKRIHILGYVPKIEPYFAHADIFVLPSHYEGFPFTLLEAMAAKSACISTDVGDISQRFSNNRDLIIIQKNNKKELSKNLKLLIENKVYRYKLAENAYEKIKSNYSWKKISENILQIYTAFSHQK
ncbi:glycosyl transferase, group 1 family protein [Aciduliprofundum boonei T469]|nr:glycosyl transferase, group 1 family protein [Aciduliprofundum boonei T469]